MRTVLFILLLAIVQGLSAQPFIDLAQLNFYGGPGVVQRLEASAALPIPLDSMKRRLLVVDPYHVRWSTLTPGTHYDPDVDGSVREEMAGNGLALTYVAPLGRSKWSLAMAGIARYHWLESTERGDWQGGGVVLAVQKINEDLTLRWGVYANDDAFGLFVRPLAGLRWRIAPGKQLFGVLPGALTYEQRLGKRLCGGFSFRAYTSSFGTRDGDYRRIDENPVGTFIDWYPLKYLVLRGEVGYSAVRQYRGGSQDPCANSLDTFGYVDHALGDGLYVRLMVAFRLRLDGNE